MSKIPIPTDADWRSEEWYVEARYAYGVLFGKTYNEVMELFKSSAISMQEDLLWIPTACLPFFFNIYMDYLVSQDSKGDSMGASCFFGLVSSRIKNVKQMESWLVEKTVNTIRHVGCNAAFYDAVGYPFRPFEKEAEEVLEKLAENSGFNPRN